jgi:hypothetical protein
MVGELEKGTEESDSMCEGIAKDQGIIGGAEIAFFESSLLQEQEKLKQHDCLARVRQ